jgi:inhibitor of KinA sporulation pathway (predicted exonuclease)
MTKFQNTLDYQTRQNAGDLSQYQNALASAQDLAKTNMSQEQAKVAQTMQNYQSQMEYANNLYNQLLQERQIMRSIYGDMYEDEYRHMQQEIEAWADNLQAETARYAQDQETARNNARLAAEKEQGNINKYLGSGYIWDGSGWVKPTAPDTSKAKNIDDLNKLYAQYKSEIADLDKQTGNFLTYLNPFGSNGMLGHLGNGFTSDQSKALQNKGFTGYLQDASPVLYDTVMNNNDYADLLRIYGAGGSSRGGW